MSETTGEIFQLEYYLQNLFNISAPYQETYLQMKCHIVLNFLQHVCYNGFADFFSLLLEMSYTSNSDTVNLWPLWDQPAHPQRIIYICCCKLNAIIHRDPETEGQYKQLILTNFMWFQTFQTFCTLKNNLVLYLLWYLKSDYLYITWFASTVNERKVCIITEYVWKMCTPNWRTHFYSLFYINKLSKISESGRIKL
jgi:hypothetical protein